jgi:GNS1/SUR4 family
MSVLDPLAASLGLPPVSAPERWCGPGGPSLVQDFADYLDPAKAGQSPGDPPLLDPLYPALGVAFFVVSKYALDWLCGALGTTGTSNAFRFFCILHNAALCIYSAWTASIALPLLVRTHTERGFWASFGDDNDEVWNGGMGMTTYLFYLSKYYEFVDSYILIVKRRPVSWLQAYHHSGAVVSVWAGVVSRSPQAMWFTGMNSVVHTIMYAYYAFTAARMGHLVVFAKRWITRMQLSQFFIGIYAGGPLFWWAVGVDGIMKNVYPVMPKGQSVPGYLNPAQQAVTFGTWLYLVGLIVLFSNFYSKTYASEQQRRQQQGDANTKKSQ